jgi:ABC-type glycerol-3-phosphate transport system substrate-binding protein
LTVKNGEQIEIYGLMDGDDGWTVFLNELEQAGASLFDTPVEQVRFDQPEVIAALQRVRSMIESGVVHTMTEGGSSEQIRPLAQAQRLAIWKTDRFSLDANEPGLEFEIGYFPRPSPNLAPDVYGQQGYVMSNGTQHPEAAWRWLSFLSRQLVEENEGSRFALPPVHHWRNKAVTGGSSIRKLRQLCGLSLHNRRVCQQPSPTNELHQR